MYIRTKHGLPWENGMKHFVEESDSVIVEEQDILSGL